MSDEPKQQITTTAPEEATQVDPIDEAIYESGLPRIVRTAILVLYHSLSKLVFTFCLVGAFLSPENFKIWFFVCIGIGLFLLVSLVYVLLLAVNHSLNRLPPPAAKTKVRALPSGDNILMSAWKGAIGNVGFYILLALIFAFIKLMGWVDPLFQRGWQQVSSPKQEQQQNDAKSEIHEQRK